EGTLKEHVPPKCFFPEHKDLLNDVDFRRNLITVHSCDEHNLRKSKDDEYLLFIIVSHFENNKNAYDHIKTKILRAIKRIPQLFSFFSNEAQRIVLGGQKTVRFQINRNRFDSELIKIAKGIYYNHFKEKLEKNLFIISPSLYDFDKKDSGELNNLQQYAYLCTEIFFTKANKFGENPDIFYYNIFRDLTRDFFLINMVFYGGFKVIALYFNDLIFSA
ncbi:MAG: hypothetical protein ABIJ45_00465, partial [Candidatus Zixiibacteriota bacterium]